MCKEFEMIDLGLTYYFLGIKVWQDEKGIFVSQRKYTLNMLHKFNMNSFKPLTTLADVGLKLSKFKESESVDLTLYKQLIKSLIYLTSTQLDIMYAVYFIPKFIHGPKVKYWQVAKRILKYLRGTIRYGLHYKSLGDYRLIGYIDSDWVGCIDDKKSTSDYVSYLDLIVVVWSSRSR